MVSSASLIWLQRRLSGRQKPPPVGPLRATAGQPQVAFPVDLWHFLGNNKAIKGNYHLEAWPRNICPKSFAVIPVRWGWKSEMSSLAIPEHLYAWRFKLRRNSALYPLRELRKWKPRKHVNLCALRDATGLAERSSPAAEYSPGVTNGMPAMSQDVSGRRQVLRPLWQTAFARARRKRSTAAAEGSSAPTHGSAGAPKGRIASFRRGRLSALPRCGSILMGVAAVRLSEGCRLSARSARPASPTAGDQPSCYRTGAADPRASGSKSGFHDACCLAGRNPVL